MQKREICVCVLFQLPFSKITSKTSETLRSLQHLEQRTILWSGIHLFLRKHLRSRWVEGLSICKRAPERSKYFSRTRCRFGLIRRDGNAEGHGGAAEKYVERANSHRVYGSKMAEQNQRNFREWRHEQRQQRLTGRSFSFAWNRKPQPLTRNTGLFYRREIYIPALCARLLRACTRASVSLCQWNADNESRN